MDLFPQILKNIPILLFEESLNFIAHGHIFKITVRVDVCAHVCTHVNACLCTVCDNVYLSTYLFACETFLLYMHAVFHNLVADAQP